MNSLLKTKVLMPKKNMLLFFMLYTLCNCFPWAQYIYFLSAWILFLIQRPCKQRRYLTSVCPSFLSLGHKSNWVLIYKTKLKFWWPNQFVALQGNLHVWLWFCFFSLIKYSIFYARLRRTEGLLVCCCLSDSLLVHQQFTFIFFAKVSHIEMKFGKQVYHNNNI